ncbi:hypothetical protein GLOTRDRAFT_109704 [Gloeophyllum trabeum ATCC 11539]|uniref:Uncharacterized protein n=1 Tax=Gloeophyllum trabeum (strain ATCC 11539 / FP-39264 / Madison 617) TaxID=670483 RepID=S7QJC5_GLOTA|nr:uncharacterized protein GLOTRDRAFT_109704 [Gloeophyllum trabeum ATCC 11539]EPQ59467.1 hypothetical protein GLOTRDRAFT_109704 [Gloeophyllum trabeum ATCC 11539]
MGVATVLNVTKPPKGSMTTWKLTSAPGEGRRGMLAYCGCSNDAGSVLMIFYRLPTISFDDLTIESPSSEDPWASLQHGSVLDGPGQGFLSTQPQLAIRCNEHHNHYRAIA